MSVDGIDGEGRAGPRGRSVGDRAEEIHDLLVLAKQRNTNYETLLWAIVFECSIRRRYGVTGVSAHARGPLWFCVEVWGSVSPNVLYDLARDLRDGLPLWMQLDVEARGE